ncbi:taurine catabolism dioxygenase [Corynebacterium alimapuense]|uniref:Taurine catabolism dioxygenase n=1 Tax=Corynebacterium alimapuense TaxID=1576874 RepID=A0A3M8KC06_9CORY|nr:taurine catabolism dioxygenase [Corynebacterium alimapuense]
MGVQVTDFDINLATNEDFAELKKAIYANRVVVLKNQAAMTPTEFVALGNGTGTIVPYYEPMYHHPEHEEIFVSSTVQLEGKKMGVPKTGKFWHSDYQFKKQPFAFTIFFPQVLPEGNRGTFFIDMAQAFQSLPAELRSAARKVTASHSVRRFFKIRPSDIYRPLGEIIKEVEQVSPPAVHNAVVTHPVTGEEFLYLSEGFTDQLDGEGTSSHRNLLHDLLEESGQLDPEFTHPNILCHSYELGDIVLWDNRVLTHRALHVSGNGASASYRITVTDDLPFDAAAGSLA